MTNTANGETRAPEKTIRTLVRGAYDLQKLRISVGNRVVGNFRAKLGQAPGERAEEVLDEDAKKVLADLKRRYRRITDALVETRQKGPFPGDEVISTFTEFALVAQYAELEKTETGHFNRIGKLLTEFPIYTEFLQDVRGINRAMAGVIISEFDITKSFYVSQMWKYAGLDVAEDGLGRSMRREHLVKRKYINAKGQEAEKDSITYNPWLKTKLMGVLATSFLMQKSSYAEYYHNYRHRIESDPARIITDTPGFHKDNTWTKARRNTAARRYMIKMFLLDLYRKWREIEGLPVTEPYSEAKLGHVHGRGSGAAA